MTKKLFAVGYYARFSREDEHKQTRLLLIALNQKPVNEVVKNSTLDVETKTVASK